MSTPFKDFKDKKVKLDDNEAFIVKEHAIVGNKEVIVLERGELLKKTEEKKTSDTVNNFIFGDMDGKTIKYPGTKLSDYGYSSEEDLNYSKTMIDYAKEKLSEDIENDDITPIAFVNSKDDTIRFQDAKIRGVDPLNPDKVLISEPDGNNKAKVKLVEILKAMLLNQEYLAAQEVFKETLGKSALDDEEEETSSEEETILDDKKKAEIDKTIEKIMKDMFGGLKVDPSSVPFEDILSKVVDGLDADGIIKENPAHIKEGAMELFDMLKTMGIKL